MRSITLFLSLFYLFVLILIASLVTNFFRGLPLLGIGEFVTMGLLVFLVLGDEWVKVTITRSGIELRQGRHSSSAEEETRSPNKVM